MSPWPCISARPRLSDRKRGRAIRPSRAETLLHSLDMPTRRLEWLRCCTLLLCFRSSRPVDARQCPHQAGLDVASHRDLRRATDPTRHQSHRPSHRAVDVQPVSIGTPPLAHDDGDERGGQVYLPRRSGLVRQPVWTSCGGLCGTLHGGSEVISSDATLPPKM